MAFPEIIGGLRNFMRGFQHSQKMEIAKLADGPENSEIEAKSNGWFFGTGDGQVSSLGTGFRRGPDCGYGGAGWAGEPVTLDSAQTLSTVTACRRILCETHACLPFQLVQKKDPASKLVFRHDLPIYDMMKHGNDDRSGWGARETWMGHLIFQGNAYGRILRRSGGTRTALDIEMLLPEWVQPLREVPYGRLKYVVSIPGLERKTYFVTPGEPHDIMHIRGFGYDGLRGYSVLSIARQTLSSGLGMEKNWGAFLANGGRLPYYLKRDQPFINDVEFNKFRDKWMATYSNPHIPPLLEGAAMSYNQIGVSAKDAQFLESRLLSVAEICRIFGVSPTLVFDLSKANFNTLESLIRSFIDFTLRGWMDRWSGDWRRCVMTPAEKKAGVYPRYSLNDLDKGDFQTRMSGYSQGLVNGMITRNEGREKEGYEPVEGLDAFLVQQQMINVQDAGTGIAQTPDEIEEVVGSDE